jgi:hypothetical protein
MLVYSVKEHSAAGTVVLYLGTNMAGFFHSAAGTVLSTIVDKYDWFIACWYTCYCA